MVLADRVELSQALLSLADFAAADAVRSFSARIAVWTIPSPSSGDLELRCCPSSVYNFPAQALVCHRFLPAKIAEHRRLLFGRL